MLPLIARARHGRALRTASGHVAAHGAELDIGLEAFRVDRAADRGEPLLALDTAHADARAHGIHLEVVGLGRADAQRRAAEIARARVFAQDDFDDHAVAERPHVEPLDVVRQRAAHVDRAAVPALDLDGAGDVAHLEPAVRIRLHLAVHRCRGERSASR
jgi:hypothetical protein